MNISSVLILEEAADDLENGKQFYSRIQSGVGQYFWDSLLSDIESLIIYAGIHTQESSFYKMLSKRFPYAIYYFIKSDIAYIVAVLPLKRAPVWLKTQLNGRA